MEQTDLILRTILQADSDQVEAALAAAAFPAWSRSGIQQRSDALDAIGSEILARREELGQLLSREEGKTLAEGIGEAARAGWCHWRHHSLELPNRDPSLEDCTCPGVQQLRRIQTCQPGASSAWALSAIISRSGLLAAVFDLVMGSGSVVGQALLEDTRIRGVSFTGSVGTGRNKVSTCRPRCSQIPITLCASTRRKSSAR